MLPTIVTTLSLSLLLTGCFKNSDKSKLSGDMELAMLTIADRIMVRYLKRLREARLKQVVDPNHDHGDLTVKVLQSTAYGQKERIKVEWGTVQADSVQVLRCMKEDLEDSDLKYSRSEKNCPDIFSTDFAKLTQDEEANKCGYVRCDLVTGKIVDRTKLIDEEASNGTVVVSLKFTKKNCR